MPLIIGTHFYNNWRLDPSREHSFRQLPAYCVPGGATIFIAPSSLQEG
jgi:hypothetical protein